MLYSKLADDYQVKKLGDKHFPATLSVILTIIQTIPIENIQVSFIFNI